jgi:hypothetical protein
MWGKGKKPKDSNAAFGVDASIRRRMKHKDMNTDSVETLKRTYVMRWEQFTHKLFPLHIDLTREEWLTLLYGWDRWHLPTVLSETVPPDGSRLPILAGDEDTPT